MFGETLSLIAFFISIGAGSCQVCGGLHESLRLMNAETVKPLSWPWMAKLYIQKKDAKGNTGGWGCGGALINKNWVLTAAHCIDGAVNHGSVKVVLGEHNLKEHENTEVDRMSEYLIKHPDWPSNRFSDIGLIRLNEKVDSKRYPHIQPACLEADDTRLNRSNCVLTGWGGTRCGKGKGENGKDMEIGIDSPDELQIVNFQIQNRSYPAGAFEAGNSHQLALSGDSGSPLVCRMANKAWVVKGVTSTSPMCTEFEDSKARGYTRYNEFIDVMHYLPWINEQMLRYEAKPTPYVPPQHPNRLPSNLPYGQMSVNPTLDIMVELMRLYGSGVNVLIVRDESGGVIQSSVFFG